MAVEQAIASRRSTRDFADEPLSLEMLSQLLWSVQGVTGGNNLRTSPSAGSTYPLEVIAVIGTFGVNNLAAGAYLYVPEVHHLKAFKSGDLRISLAQVALGQQAIKAAPVDVIIVADYERTRSRYRNRTERYVHMEAGHAAQNLYLQATALGLGTTAIGAFDDIGVKELLAVPGNFQPLYIMPVGVPAKATS